MTQPITVSILSYDSDERGFKPDIEIKGILPDPTTQLQPSLEWMTEYRLWNKDSHPTFETMTDLIDFNEKGHVLCEKLTKELASMDDFVRVEPFQPLFSNVRVSDKVCDWWYIKDQNYGFAVPISHLPVSESLKEHIAQWRKKRCEDMLDRELQAEVEQEAHELEEHLLWELNVHPIDVAGPSCATVLQKQETPSIFPIVF